MKLTQANVQRLSLAPGNTDEIHFDDEVAGFGVRLRKGGSKVWICQYKIGKKQRRITLGSLKVLDSTRARASARDLLAKVRLGADPANDKAVARVAAAETFGVTVVRFLARQKGHLRPRGYAEAKRYLEKYLRPLHPVAIDKITRAAIVSKLSLITEKNGAVSSDRARTALSGMFAWAIREGLCELNPVVGTNKAVPNPATRDRVLSDSELGRILVALPANDYGRILRLLILTGCRREEVGSLRWTEIDFENCLITLPGERTKNKRSFEVPLSPCAVSTLGGCPRRVNREFVFGGGVGGYQGWSKSKADLDKNLTDMAPWRLHDIRRSVATGMANIGIQPYIVEACLNHVSGHKAGVAGVYNRSSYTREKRLALDTWASHIAVVQAQADGSNITKLRG